MKRVTVLFALLACLGLVALPAATAKTKRVKTTVTLNFNKGGVPYSQYTEDTFSGKVKSKKKACKKKRLVTISNGAGRTKSDKNGNYAVVHSPAPAGTYTATVKKKKITKANGNVILCKAAKSPPVVVP